MVAELIRQLKAEGIGIFLITHDIREVMALCDRVSVMKNGRLVGTVRVADVSEDDLLGMILLGKPPATRLHGRAGGAAMYLGIDIGTSSVKTVLFDRDQRLIGQASQALTVLAAASRLVRAGPGGLVDGGRGHRSARSPASTGSTGLRGIGLSGQMHGAVCLDHDDQVLRPAILWNDGRAMAECAEIEAAFPRAREVAGNIAMPGFTAPKIAWMRKHEPELYARIDTVLLPKDYVRLRLTGHHVSEMSDASGTFWLDVGARDWSDDLLEATGLSRSHMPRLVEGSAPSGELLPELARALGDRGAGGGRRRRRRQRRGGLRRRAWCGRGRPSCRSAPRGCSSSRTRASRPTPRARCMPSATRSRTPGTRWG